QNAKGEIIPELATGYTMSHDATTYNIHLRHGVVFSDGTPFDAQAVLYNFQQDLNPSRGCQCLINFPVATLSAPNAFTVVIQLKRPDGALIDAFPDETPNWIISPSALQLQGALESAIAPVGAGPFMVRSDIPSTELTLVRNPRYWSEGLPYLDRLIFKVVSSDIAAYADLRNGEAQVYVDYSAYRSLASIARYVNVLNERSTGADYIEFNTAAAPFNNLLAREAIAYATDPVAINRSVFGAVGRYTESLTGPGDLFYEPKVPMYRTFDLDEARTIVSELGGSLNVTLLSPSDTQSRQIDDVLASEWARVGIHATIEPGDFVAIVQDHRAGSWELELSIGGSFDPATGFGLASELGSGELLSGTHDSRLDTMIEAASEPTSTAVRSADYAKIFRYISENEYALPLIDVPRVLLSAKDVTWPTTEPGLQGPALGAYYQRLAYASAR
ncbi:MAG: ABC transporter substrate-binding protein, partial [Acidimicrobiales bacterium]